MEKINYINATEFLETLKDRGLVIVSAKDFEASKEIQRKRLMKRKSLSLVEIVGCSLLPLTSKKGVNDWILSGKIKEDEWYQEQTGRKRVMILTKAIKRLGYEY
ncbi:hypothetical protein [Flavobacterium algicola]|uniref:hypothetical protein n=1 Tax=Flavobacterium algicola TaxID=556529 RepID=UPI001EFE5482|nr:hypothetical protein [Flavobacterium algicola]MCG9792511.1 hypothetical protein [Flavobacterium algicola]